MRRLTIHFEIAFGKDEEEETTVEYHEISAEVEEAEQGEAGELRRPIGFGPEA